LGSHAFLRGFFIFTSPAVEFTLGFCCVAHFYFLINTEPKFEMNLSSNGFIFSFK